MINIFSYSDKGCELAVKISQLLEDANCYASEKNAEKHGLIPYQTLSQATKDFFYKSDALIYVGAVGIAVRAIAPYIVSKESDPAVIVIDDNVNFIIPILSGHIGGANRLANELSQKLSATAVITTATDINGKFSVDEWASRMGFVIDSLDDAKKISAEILRNDVGIKSDFEIISKLPSGLTQSNADYGIYVTYSTSKPFNRTLRIIPKIVHIGMGCRRGVEFSAVEELFLEGLSEAGIDIKSVASISSIDLKKDEEALHILSEKYSIPLKFYSADELKKAEGEFTHSDFVKGITGVDNVCERAASVSSKSGSPLLNKKAKNAVTVAIYSDRLKIEF